MMYRFGFIYAGLTALLSVTTLAPAPLARAQSQAPPAAPVREVTDDYFGVKVQDPYRWMEDAGSAELRGWMKAQAEHARASLERLPARRLLLERVIALGGSASAVTSTRRSIVSFWPWSVLVLRK